MVGWSVAMTGSWLWGSSHGRCMVVWMASLRADTADVFLFGGSMILAQTIRRLSLPPLLLRVYFPCFLFYAKFYDQHDNLTTLTNDREWNRKLPILRPISRAEEMRMVRRLPVCLPVAYVLQFVASFRPFPSRLSLFPSCLRFRFAGLPTKILALETWAKHRYHSPVRIR